MNPLLSAVNGDLPIPAPPGEGTAAAAEGEAEKTNERTEEKVAYTADASHTERFIPNVSVTKFYTALGKDHAETSTREFQANDMARVLDFEGVSELPQDAAMMFLDDAGKEGLKFPVRHFRLRGGFLFYFDVEDVDDDNRHYVTFHAPPLGVVPLYQISVEFPPGGRRVFREHSHTDARNGYEMVLLHAPDDDSASRTRPPTFIVAESLGQREKWANALRARADVVQDTKLRAAYSVTQTARAREQKEKEKDGDEARAAKEKADAKRFESEDEDIQDAVAEFGIGAFEATRWIDNFFEVANDFDAPAKCRQMEQWSICLRRGLKGAVMEQYEYFVEASAEMTTMGHEVISLKNMVETQLETIKSMQDIIFSDTILDLDKDELMHADSDDEEYGVSPTSRALKNNRDDSDMSSVSSAGEVETPQHNGDDTATTTFEIPAWLEDAGEEITAFVKEMRYTAAVDMVIKSRNEISEILQQHDQPIASRSTRKKVVQVHRIQKQVEDAVERMTSRMSEGLRRKNEALKQASKRERNDAQSAQAPSVSPCCLDDDAIPLQLLVRLGKTQDAAEAYASRRSLLLLESLHEKPISGLGNVDLVIYSAQLSQSFFSSLARAVEGFLDLFLTEASTEKEDASIGDGSIMSHQSKNVPAGAIASVVLWCEEELNKFSNAFGGARILGNLALSPPSREKQRGPRILGQVEPNGSKERQSAIELAAKCVDQAFLHASEHLDNVGLPLTPCLAESIRSRLKGCEAEVGALLDPRWSHITLEWQNSEPLDDPNSLVGKMTMNGEDHF